MTATLKQKSCKHCKTKYQPTKSMQVVCSPMCGLERARKKREAEEAKSAKVERAADRRKREEQKRIPDLIKEAQTVFNRWIRARDEKEPCISCGASPPDLRGLHAGRDAGHYRSVGSASHLRFDERNCHAQCVHCNQWRAGNAVDYRIGLVARIGAAAVAALEADNAPRRWTRDELIAIKATYTQKLKAMKEKA